MTETCNRYYSTRYFLSTRDRNKQSATHKVGIKAILFSLFINLTHCCNLDCSICLVKSDLSSRKKQELDTRTIKQILDEAASLGALNVGFSGGEPLLREDFEDVYVYAIKKGFLVSIYSNITLLTSSTLDLFQRYPPDRIQVSVYGLSREIYEKVTRVPGSFDSFMNNLAGLRERRIRLSLQFTLCSSNEKECEHFIHSFPKKDYELKNATIYLYKHMRSDARRNALIEQVMLPPAKMAYYVFKYQFSSRMGFLFSPSDRRKIRGQNKLFWRCLKDIETLSISPSGECCFCYEMPVPENRRQYKPGKLKEIVRVLLEEKKNAIMPDIECRDCPNLLYCEWCPLYAYVFMGKLAPIPYFCEVMKELNLLGVPMLTEEVIYAGKEKEQKEKV
ncbi:MAG: radical SAM protein [Candidatus Omnitrophica bacterium]|nr:radical SAM protein [Candidatus Omnitrophota bacterium]MBU1853449.1 radical SAM protein [Candidatus Omnitrophota bacterium]